MIAAIYTNQSTHIWNQAAPPAQERTVPGWSYFWKRPRETAKWQSSLLVVLTIRTRVQTTRHDAKKPVTPDLTDLKREILEEAEAVLRQEEARRQEAREEAIAQAERVRLHRQAEDDEELMLAAALLLREEPPIQWTVRQPRRNHVRRRK